MSEMDQLIYVINKRDTVEVSLKGRKGQQRRRRLQKRQLKSECDRVASNFIAFI